MKILIVDDEQDVALLFRQKFRKELKSGEFELVFAFSAQEAIDYLKLNNAPQFIYVFSDINMPGMSGHELLEFINEHYPDISVSMISAYGDRENFEKAVNSGAKDFFTKPIDFNLLKEKIRNLSINY